jgi:nucleotide-binding universal stress UspA family protein
MDRLRSILAAVDFSACSEDAFRQAARLSEACRATLAALHVVDMVLVAPAFDPLLPVAFPQPVDLMPDVQAQWARFAPDCPGKSGATLSVEFGSPRDQILETVRRQRPDLLVVGARGVMDAHREIGPTASACVQRAPCRVLVVREGQRGPFRSVVACVDMTETSRMALEQAIRVGAMDGAAVHVLHVYGDPWHGLPMPPEVSANMPDFPRRYRQAVENRLRRFCEPMAHELGALKAEFHAVQAPNHGEGIIAFVQRHGCDLAVLGTRSTWNLRDLFWGSTAERVVRRCPSSVLTVKPAGFGSEHAS